ncbi:flagellar protein FlgN [Castellaniella sp.]|uniref:flagella synthesis protein FlgN n=1 Tax=Castellaniella sp. TaxID=1955812 RepID=UPI002B000EED|nr:flagellar protein FlgN [Castellaniella sp.]
MNHIDALLHCVDEQSALLNEFIETLQAEGDLLLGTPSNEALSALAIRKADYARRLAELDQNRATTLTDLGQPNDRHGIAAICAEYPDLQYAFEILFERAEQASSLNHANGETIKAFTERNQQALDTLRGLMGEDLYDAHGRLPKK